MFFYYLDWSASSTEAVFGYAHNMFSDLSGFVYIIVGVGVALLIFDAIIGSITAHKK